MVTPWYYTRPIKRYCDYPSSVQILLGCQELKLRAPAKPRFANGWGWAPARFWSGTNRTAKSLFAGQGGIHQKKSIALCFLTGLPQEALRM